MWLTLDYTKVYICFDACLFVQVINRTMYCSSDVCFLHLVYLTVLSDIYAIPIQTVCKKKKMLLKKWHIGENNASRQMV